MVRATGAVDVRGGGDVVDGTVEGKVDGEGFVRAVVEEEFRVREEDVTTLFREREGKRLVKLIAENRYLAHFSYSKKMYTCVFFFFFFLARMGGLFP